MGAHDGAHDLLQPAAKRLTNLRRLRPRRPGFKPSGPVQELPAPDPRAPAWEAPVLKSFEVDVRQDEMLTPEGVLHPRAARAWSHGMVQERGGEFEVYVPLTQRHNVEAGTLLRTRQSSNRVMKATGWWWCPRAADHG